MQANKGGRATQQLALPFELHKRSTFERFVAGENGELVERLKAPRQGAEAIWLFGTPGVGKTHLLLALCQRHANSAYIPAGDLAPTALDGRARIDVVAIDDVPRWLGERRSEIALFDFYNNMRAGGALLALSADRSPLELEFALADLGSRMRAAACYHVAPLADCDKARLLCAAAHERGLVLGDEVVRFLLSHVGRGQGELLNTLDRLDCSSLATQRRITIPFAKEVLCL